MLSRRTREKYGPVGSNTDSGSKRGVQFRDSSVLYLDFIVRNLFLILIIIIYFNIEKYFSSKNRTKSGFESF